jgi:colicin import membrane protein
VSAVEPTSGAPYRVPPEPNRWPSIVLATAIHAALLAFLWIGISWQNNEPVAVEAEVWDMKTQSAAPPAPPAPQPVEDTPPPPAPAPAPAPKVTPPAEEKVVPKPPDIALEREKQRKLEKAQRQEEERQEREQAARDEQKRQDLADKLAREKADKAEKLAAKRDAEKLAQKKADEADRKAQELADKKAADKAAEKKEADKLAAAEKKKALEKAAKAKEAAENKMIADNRAAEMRRLTGQAGAGNGTNGTAAKSTAPRSDPGYVASITSAIKSRSSYAGDTDVPGNPKVVFHVEQLPTGEIVSVRKTKSSGIPEFDRAVENAINKSSPLPKKKDGTVERSLEVGFSMKDLN